MIEVYQHEEAGRTPGFWIAECTIDGEAYAARSQHAAPHELARLLVNAGIPDQPMTVRSFGLAGHAAYRSIHAAAKRTIAESATTRGPVSGRWVDPGLVDFAALRAHRQTNAGVAAIDPTVPDLEGSTEPDASLPVPVAASLQHTTILSVTCEVCGAPIEPALRGPQHRYCSPTCRSAPAVPRGPHERYYARRVQADARLVRQHRRA